MKNECSLIDFLRKANENLMSGVRQPVLSSSDEKFMEEIRAVVTPFGDGEKLRAIYKEVKNRYADSPTI